jgi:hypothetical protein
MGCLYAVNTAAQVLARAFNALGPYDYTPASHNCQHFASWVLFKAAYSEQCTKVLRYADLVAGPAVSTAVVCMRPSVPVLCGSTWLGSTAVRLGLKGIVKLVPAVSRAAAVGVGCGSGAAAGGTGQVAAWLLGKPHRNWEGDWEAALCDCDPQKQLIRCLLQGCKESGCW